jgi:hypothetical protein
MREKDNTSDESRLYVKGLVQVDLHILECGLVPLHRHLDRHPGSTKARERQLEQRAQASKCPCESKCKSQSKCKSECESGSES